MNFILSSNRINPIACIVGFLFILSYSFTTELLGKDIDDLKAKIKTIRNDNIEKMHQVLKKNQYQGYDFIIISSTTQEEADYQQQVLEKAFEGTAKKDGSAPIILSVVDFTEGGQIIGAIFTWLKAEEILKKKFPHLLPHSTTFLEYLKNTQSKAAVFHNGGKGERCSPLTQSLGNSRGAQKLVGSVKNALEESIELNVLLGVILQCSSFALTNQGSHIDTYWTSQIAFGSHQHDKLIRSNSYFDKFLVGFDKNQLIAQNIADFGTAALSQTGQMKAFYGNKRFATRKGNEYVIDQKKIEEELFSKGDRVAYDFGSFSVHLDMWQLLIDYWKRKFQFEIFSETVTRANIKRDIDPHFIQPLIRLLYALNDLIDRRSIDAKLPLPSKLLCQEDFDNARNQFLQNLLSSSPDAYAYIWEDIESEKDKKKKDEAALYMNEVIEFYLLNYQSRPFADLTKIFGYIDLGDETQWFRYRRPIDIMNEKFEMLADLIGKKIEVQLNGTLLETEIDDAQIQRSIESRLMRGLKDHEIAKFTVEGKPVTLTLDQVKRGIWVENVYVENAIIQKSDLTKGSMIVNSVIHGVTGKIHSAHSYLESSIAPFLAANVGVIHEVVDDKNIVADKEVVTDVYRTHIAPPYHGRMRAPIGYDPKGMPIYQVIGKNEQGLPIYSQEMDPSIKYFVKRIPYNLMSAKELSDLTARTEDGRFTFEEIRRIDPLKNEDVKFKELLQLKVKEILLNKYSKSE